MMSDDILDRLKSASSYEYGNPFVQHLAGLAADEIERLRARLATLKETVEIQTVQPLRARIEELSQIVQECEQSLAERDSRIEELEKKVWVERARADQPVDGHIITTEQIANAEKHIKTSSLPWVKAFAYGVLFELGLLDE